MCQVLYICGILSLKTILQDRAYHSHFIDDIPFHSQVSLEAPALRLGLHISASNVYVSHSQDHHETQHGQLCTDKKPSHRAPACGLSHGVSTSDQPSTEAAQGAAENSFNTVRGLQEKTKSHFTGERTPRGEDRL